MHSSLPEYREEIRIFALIREGEMRNLAKILTLAGN